MLQRDELRDQHAIVRGLRDRQMEIAAGARVGRRVVNDGFSFIQQAPEFLVIGGCRMLGGKLRRMPRGPFGLLFSTLPAASQ